MLQRVPYFRIRHIQLGASHSIEYEERRRESDDPQDELPPADVQGPSTITKAFEDRKLGLITEIEFEHGAWQVKFRETGRPVMLLIPRSAPRGTEGTPPHRDLRAGFSTRA